MPITDGVAGSEVPVLASQLNGVFCRATGVCLAVGSGLDGGGVVVPLRNGAVGHSGGTVKGAGGLSGIACHAGSSCVAVGGTSVIAPLTRMDVRPARTGCQGSPHSMAWRATTRRIPWRSATTLPARGRRYASLLRRTVPPKQFLERPDWNAIACPGPDTCLAVGQGPVQRGRLREAPAVSGGPLGRVSSNQPSLALQSRFLTPPGADSPALAVGALNSEDSDTTTW